MADQILTPRMKWPIPKENADPWYDPFVDMLAEVDASGYAAREDRNIIPICSGDSSFDSGTGVAGWSAAIELTASNGMLWTIATGNITLAEGEVAYVVLPRYPTNSVTLTPAKTTSLGLVPGAGVGDDIYALCIRRGGALYWRPGLFQGTGGGGGGTADSIGVLIFRPASGLSGPTVFENWADLYAKLVALRSVNGGGLYRIQFDLPGSPTTSLPSGTYDMSGVTWEGNTAKGPQTYFEISQGAVFTGGPKKFSNLYIASKSTSTPPFSLTEANNQIELRRVGISAVAGCVAFAITGSASSTIFEVEHSEIGDATNPVISAANTCNGFFEMLDGGELLAKALKTAGSGNFGAEILASSARVVEDQPAAAGFDFSGDNTLTQVRHFTDDNENPGGYTQSDAPIPLTPSYLTLVNATGSVVDDFGATLPPIAGGDTRFCQVLVKETSRAGTGFGGDSSNNPGGVRVAPFGSETIDNSSADMPLEPGQTAILISDGTSNWTSVKTAGVPQVVFASCVLNPGGGVNLRLAQYNISAVSETATGTYELTYASAPPAGYDIDVQVCVSNNGASRMTANYGFAGASDLTIYVYNSAGSLNSGATRISVAVFLVPVVVSS